ncbi:MAG TPA: hypothetical protein VJ962_05125 [Clostridia bacterium]|nr:hypothetical protein [Clostridia bacterium]
MKEENIIKIFEDYRNKIGNRRELYKNVIEKYNVESILYPGSHVDIEPSFLISKVIYVDNFKGTISFFKHIDVIKDYIEKNKYYKEQCNLVFKAIDYRKPLNIEPVDLIISQYAGFVGQGTKEYLKTGGILLCNDSHGDATLARFDTDYKLIGVIDHSYRIIETGLDKYFTLSKERTVNLDKVKKKMKGPKYIHKAENYLFRKVN